MQEVLNEEKIIQSLIADDYRVIKKIYSQYKKGCMYTLKNLGSGIDDAKDIYQEAFVAFVTNVKKGKFRGESNLNTYINTIAKYKYFNQIKKQKIRTEDISELNIELEDKSEEEFASELIDDLLKNLNALDSKCLMLLRSFYFRGIDLRTISQEMSVTYDFVRQKKKRCINKLKGNMVKV